MHSSFDDRAFANFFTRFASKDGKSAPTVVRRALLSLISLDATPEWRFVVDRATSAGGTEWVVFGLSTDHLVYVRAESSGPDWHAHSEEGDLRNVVAFARPRSAVRRIEVLNVIDANSRFSPRNGDTWSAVYGIRLRDEPDLLVRIPPFDSASAFDVLEIDQVHEAIARELLAGLA